MSKKSKPIEKQSFDVIRQNDIINRPLRSIHENVDRKCFTPSVCKSSKTKTTRSNSFVELESLTKNDDRKSRNKSSDRQMNKLRGSELSGSNIEIVMVDKPKKQKLQDSAWKYKSKGTVKLDRPSSTLANARHAKHLQFNLHNLNESVHRNEQDSLLRMKQLSFQHLDRAHHTTKEVYLLIEEGRKHLKSNKFAKAADCFKQCLKIQGHDNNEAAYLLGICYFHLGNYHQCIDYLSGLLTKNDEYKKNIFFFLSIAQKRCGDTEAALKTLDIAIDKIPKYYDALLFRGKLLAKQKKYLEAIDDFKTCIKIDASKIAPYVSMADCYRYIHKFDDAIELYSKSLKLNPLDLSILLKRAITYIQNNRLSLAQEDLDEIIRHDPYNSQADLFRGLVYYNTHNYNDAILCYEQAIKHNSSKKAVTKSILQIAKIKIQLRDFYGASYTLERADSLDVDKKVLEKIKFFTDGSTFLMKKKIKKGVDVLSQLIKKQNINEYIRPLTFSFRSYGYFCQCKYTHSLNDLETLEKHGYEIDNASQYNKCLLEGIIASLNNKFQQGLDKFFIASKMRPATSDPDIYRCLTLVTMYNRTQTTRNIQFSDAISSALEAISLAISKEQGNCNTYYIRAVILYSLEKYKQAWEDIEKAIDKSDDHVIKHFYLRALIYSGMGKYKESLGDFSNTISLMKDLREKEMSSAQDQDVQPQKQIPQSYLNRAKCYLMFGEKKRAFQDLQSYTAYKLLDPQIHIFAGRLLFSIGAAEDAIKAYSNCPHIDKNIPILMERAKCYLLLKQLNLCLKDMQKVVDSGDQKMLFDLGCLESLRQASKNNTQSLLNAIKRIKSVEEVTNGDGYIFTRADFHFYRGLYHVYLRDYDKAIEDLQKSFKIKESNQCLDRLSTSQLDNDDCYDNRIFTAEEIEYNIGIVHLLMGNRTQASKILTLQSFKVLFQPNNDNETINSDDLIDLTPFPTNNRLCSIFPALSLPTFPQYEFRLSFCLPKVTPPQTELNIEENQICKLNINSTEPRPDAPWIKRNSFGVVFTQDVVGCEVDLNTDNEKSQQQDSNQNNEAVRIDIANDRSMEFQGYFKDEEPEEKDRTKLKDLLTLDPETEAKLARLLKK